MREKDFSDLNRFDRAILNPIRPGLDHTALVEVKLQDTREAAPKAVNEAARRVPEIVQANMIAGNFDDLLKVRMSDLAECRRVCRAK